MENVMEFVGKVAKVKVVGDAFTGRKTKERKIQEVDGNLVIEYKGLNYPVEYLETEKVFQVIKDTTPFPVVKPEKPAKKDKKEKEEPESAETTASEPEEATEGKPVEEETGVYTEGDVESAGEPEEATEQPEEEQPEGEKAE